MQTRFVTPLVIGLVIGFVAGVVFSAWKLEDLSGSSRQSHPKPQVGGQADAKAQRSQTEKRISGIERMLAANPNNVEALIQLGNDYFDLHAFPKAVEAYQKALKIDPNNADAAVDLGVAFRRLGKPREAAKAFQEALKADNKHAGALFNLGIVYRDDLNEPEKALQAWEKFLERVGDAPHAVMVRPWVKKLKDGLKDKGSPKTE